MQSVTAARPMVRLNVSIAGRASCSTAQLISAFRRHSLRIGEQLVAVMAATDTADGHDSRAHRPRPFSIDAWKLVLRAGPSTVPLSWPPRRLPPHALLGRESSDQRFAMVSNNALAPGLQQRLQRALVAFAQAEPEHARRELGSPMVDIQVPPGDLNSSRVRPLRLLFKESGGPSAAVISTILPI